MKSIEIARLIDQIERLPVEKIGKVKKVVAKREGDVESLLVLQEKTENMSACPHCGDKAIVRNGIAGSKRTAGTLGRGTSSGMSLG